MFLLKILCQKCVHLHKPAVFKMATFRHLVKSSRLPISFIPVRRATGSTTSEITRESMPPSTLIALREGKLRILELLKTLLIGFTYI